MDVATSEHVLTERPHRLFVRAWEPGLARYALVLVHGTAGHGGCYDAFAERMAGLGVRVYSGDLEGHGRSGGARGVFTFAGFLADVDAFARFARSRGSGPVVLLGASQGGEVAFHAGRASHAVDATICMNILLNDERPMNARVRWMRSRAARWLAAVVGDRVRVPLPRVIDFAAAYEQDPGALAAKLRDPEYVWRYGFASYRSVFAYRPASPAIENTKPVLVACGADDPIVGAAHCRACFDRLGGPKDLFVLPGGGHHLMMFHAPVFARVIDDWVRRRAIAREPRWVPPITDEETRAHAFVSAIANAPPDGEPGYRYTVLDRALARIVNGELATGVRYFAGAHASEQWRFTREVVSEIDVCAWRALAPWLARVDGAVPRRIAIVGIGDGLAVEKLLARHRELAGWDIDCIDADAGAIAEARARLGARVRCVVGDARLEGVMPAGAYGVVYMHGVFDHCDDHRGRARRCPRARDRRSVRLRGTGSQRVHVGRVRRSRSAARVQAASLAARLPAVRATERDGRAASRRGVRDRARRPGRPRRHRVRRPARAVAGRARGARAQARRVRVRPRPPARVARRWVPRRIPGDRPQDLNGYGATRTFMSKK